jgi:hypothetical protein
MNRPLRLLLLGVMFVAALMLASAARAASNPDQLNAEAFFDSQQSTVRPGDPCVRTRVGIDAEERFVSGEDTLNQVELDIVEFDDCVVDDFGLVAEWYTIAVVPDNALMIDPNLRHARLRATIMACNLVDDDDCRTFDLNVHWKGTGEIEVDGGSSFREAEAKGRVFDTTFGLNLAPNDAVFASLSRFDNP